MRNGNPKFWVSDGVLGLPHPSETSRLDGVRINSWRTNRASAPGSPEVRFQLPNQPQTNRKEVSHSDGESGLGLRWQHARVLDGDAISPTNCVRQPFARAEIGLNKAIVLVNRLNLFWRLKWEAVPAHLKAGTFISRSYTGADLRAHIVIGCVDTRDFRGEHSEAPEDRR
jgi:hypothetical protein